jgi:cytochrome c-type biogenesis protein CcmH
MERNRIPRLLSWSVLGASLLAFTFGAAGQEISARERALQERLMGACCWNETIAHHRSETALEQRVELSKLIKEGRTDAEILDWFKGKYGARVLVEPEGNLSLTAYALPAIAAVIGLGIVVVVLRRWAAKAAATA